MNMKKLRKNVGLTQKEVAEKVGVSQVYISKIERGETKVLDGLTVHTLKRLAKVFKMTIYEMLKILIENN